MAQLSTSLSLPQLLTKWTSILNPFLKNPMNNILILDNINLVAGINNVDHKLQRLPQGWFIIDPQSAATVYRSAPYSTTTLTLTSSASLSCQIGVF